jgi:hypothetical protein
MSGEGIMKKLVYHSLKKSIDLMNRCVPLRDVLNIFFSS